MTTIVSGFAPTHLIQVADRKLTDYDTGEEVADNRNKVVQLGRNLILGYTGLAAIGAKPTDEWLQDVLIREMASHGDRAKALYAVGDAATSVFKTIRLPAERKRHAFVALGWGRFPSEAAVEPFRYVISNFAGDDRWLPKANDTFTVGLARPGRGACGFFTVGQDFPKRQREALFRQVVETARRGLGPAAMARLLAHAVIELARYNKRVGKGLLVSVLPAPTAETTSGPLAAARFPPVAPTGLKDYFDQAISNTDPSFVYVPPTNPDHPVAYGPLIVGPGMSFRGIELGIEGELS